MNLTYQAALLASTIIAGIVPPPPMTGTEWADANYYLSAESAAEPGKWRTLPYQVEMLNCMTDRDTEQVSVKKSARVGYTKCLNAACGYYMEHDPSPILLVQPTDDDAKDYSKDEIYPMIRDCPAIEAVMRDPLPGEPQESMTYKPFKGGVFQMVGAQSPKSFRRVSRKIIALDEVNGYPVSSGDEGDPIRLAIKRAEYYWDRKIIAGSTPTLEHGRIDKLFEQGDQRHFYVPCPHCKHKQVLRFDRMKWPKGKPEEAYYECESCLEHIEYRHQRWMVTNGEWRAHRPENYAKYRHASFHIWAAYSFSPNATWGQIAKEFVDAEAEGYEALKTFVNTVLGESWKDKGEAPDWQRIYDKREEYQMGIVPKGGLFITAGVDVQKHGLIYVVRAWGRGKESWLIDWGTLPGAPNEEATFKQLDQLLAHQYPHAETGVLMPVGIMAVDSGAYTQLVYNWCRQYPMNRVMAIKGMPRGNVLLGSPVAVDVNINGKRMSRGYKYWPVGGAVAKGEIYAWLRLDGPTDDERAVGVLYHDGYMHHPMQTEAEYFKQLTGEQLVPHKNKRGYVNLEWQKIPGRQNHALDASAYCRAAAALYGLDRFTENEWRALESLLVAKPEKNSDDDAPNKGGHGGRISKRPTGWLKGGR